MMFFKFFVIELFTSSIDFVNCMLNIDINCSANPLWGLGCRWSSFLLSVSSFRRVLLSPSWCAPDWGNILGLDLFCLLFTFRMLYHILERNFPNSLLRMCLVSWRSSTVMFSCRITLISDGESDFINVFRSSMVDLCWSSRGGSWARCTFGPSNAVRGSEPHRLVSYKCLLHRVHIEGRLYLCQW